MAKHQTAAARHATQFKRLDAKDPITKPGGGPTIGAGKFVNKAGGDAAPSGVGLKVGPGTGRGFGLKEPNRAGVSPISEQRGRKDCSGTK